MDYKKQNNPAERPLVEKVLRGDTNAFKVIMKNTEGLVAQIIFKMIPDSEDRKDIAQEIYLKAYRNLASFKFHSKLSTWIAQIAYNTCINFLEKRKLVFFYNGNDHNESVDEVPGIQHHNPDPSDNETEKLLFKQQLSKILKTEIDKLSPVYKTLITLYHNEELSYAEIAEISRLPEGTVKNYLFRARKILRDNILLTYKKEEL